ncbi:GL11481 [Drosophila persimilis]|uniref:GL11481 n=1 Tax=Drosophila persimilis TaxID=7234 RepID=B4GB24_DROPE|nr:GL11481 [Drosophila persimilis]
MDEKDTEVESEIVDSIPECNIDAKTLRLKSLKNLCRSLDYKTRNDLEQLVLQMSVEGMMANRELCVAWKLISMTKQIIQ